MASIPQELLEQVLQLPETQRAELAATLLESLEPTGEPKSEGWQAVWAEETRRRIEQIERNEIKMIPGDEARKRVRSDVPPGI